MQVAMMSDIRFASDNSQFGIPAAKLGIAYGYDGLKHLVSLVGPSWARLIMYTGMKIDSTEAVRIGLVDRVLPDAELWDATMEIARTISGNAPLAIKAAKLTIAQVLKDESRRDMDAIRQVSIACMDSEDFREGRTAFMEKRKPRFKGK
jgi:enoyl-CoA hydratase/carnithine racemase